MQRSYFRAIFLLYDTSYLLFASLDSNWILRNDENNDVAHLVFIDLNHCSFFAFKPQPTESCNFHHSNPGTNPPPTICRWHPVVQLNHRAMALTRSSRVHPREFTTPAPRCLLLVSTPPWAPCSRLARPPAPSPSSSVWARPRMLPPTPPPSVCIPPPRPPHPSRLPRDSQSPTAAAPLLMPWEPVARPRVHPSAWHRHPTTPHRCTSSSVWAATPRSRPPRGWCTLQSSTRSRTSCTPPLRCRGLAVLLVSASRVMIWWAACLECLSSCFRIGRALCVP